MKSDLDCAFATLARALFSRHPEIHHEWREVSSRLWGDRTDIVCCPGSPNEVYASLLGGQIAVGTGGGHDDFEDFGRGLSDEAVAREAFARLVELLIENGQLATRE